MASSTTLFRALPFAVATSVALMVPGIASAQSGKWVATIGQLASGADQPGGAADITIEPRNDKQSKAKISLRNTKRDMRIAWDIVAGSCRDEGIPIAAAAAFTKVQTQMDGAGTATSNIPKLESGKKYYVRVFDPQMTASDANAYGCANLSEKP